MIAMLKIPLRSGSLGKFIVGGANSEDISSLLKRYYYVYNITYYDILSQHR
jgi:hypothetical protein